MARIKKSNKVPILRRVKPETKAYLDECGVSLDRIVSRYKVLSFTSPFWKRRAMKQEERLTQESGTHRRLLLNYQATRERMLQDDLSTAGDLFREEVRSRNLPPGFEQEIIAIWDAVEERAKPVEVEGA